MTVFRAHPHAHFSLKKRGLVVVYKVSSLAWWNAKFAGCLPIQTIFAFHNKFFLGLQFLKQQTVKKLIFQLGFCTRS